MEIGARLRTGKDPSTTVTAVPGGWLARTLATLLILLGTLSVLAAAAYAAYSMLNTWLMNQDRYLRGQRLAAFTVPDMTWTPSPSPTPSALPTHTGTPTPTPSVTPTPRPQPPPSPVRIRIPALGVNRSIIPLPRVRDRRTGAWTWNTDRLFRSGRSDLVGHWQGSAYPGQDGNMVLVGHNYGYGYNGVFVHLGKLRKGQKIYVVNQSGQTFVYRVTEVQRLPWRLKSFGELTLVSCAGAEVEPFPKRIYVVAEPVD
jgi:LPXTG-site transpeptidase (sortase) family protein